MHISFDFYHHHCSRIIFLIQYDLFNLNRRSFIVFVIFWWFRTFINYIIYRSASKTFTRCMFSSLSVQINSRESFYLIMSFSLIFLLAELLLPPQKVHFVWTIFSLYLFIPHPELLSRFK